MDERKRKRLEAWRKKREQEKAQVKVSLSVPTTKKRKKQAPVVSTNLFGSLYDADDDSGPDEVKDDEPMMPGINEIVSNPTKSSTASKRTNRWDNASSQETKPTENDALDQFMDKLVAGAVDEVSLKAGSVKINIGGSVMRGGDEQPSTTQPVYQPSDWLSDAPMTPGMDNEEEEQEGRRALIEALKGSPAKEAPKPVVELKQQVQSEKSRRENRLKELEVAASAVTKAQQTAVDFGRMDETTEDGILEEAQQLFQHAAAPDALTVLAEINKKKELKALDHSTIDYAPFTKNLYRVPRAYASMTNDEVVNSRAKLHVRVRGQGAPAPVDSFAEMGLTEAILQHLEAQGIHKPYPIQAQCIPCILAGRDVIGIAKTGSGKTLAYALPLLRHVSVQEHSDTPVALILTPARELAFQIHTVCKSYAKIFGLRSTAIYGGAGVAEQIADIKRGVQIVTATPGRLIDLLTLQNGKLLSLQRVTFVVMDEADRMFDMGFAPQIQAILSAIRPDRQTLLFSATFPKQIEKLARQSLKYPVEVLVGGRSIASDSVTQYAELVEESDKFLRLLQILGEQVEGTKKVIVFVDTQVRSDRLFEQLLRNGYSTLSLHGGKEQEDRDSTLSDFKRKDGPNVLVATGVAARGLDVPACSCVVNFCSPNHLEAYVHQTGRTGRAGNKGVCYTLLSNDEAQFAPIITRALNEAGQAENIDPALKELSDSFKSKVEKGEAKFAGSGFKGKGYSYDSTEMNEAQRMAHLEKRQALIEAGLMDADEEDPLLASATEKNSNEKKNDKKLDVPENLTPELLALPGMKEALMRKAGIMPPVGEVQDDETKHGKAIQTPDNHWLQEFEINDYPREALWKVTQKETTSRMQDEFRTAITVKGSYFAPGKEPPAGERKIYLHMEAAEIVLLQSAVLEIERMLSEETLRVSAKATGVGSHKYTVI